MSCGARVCDVENTVAAAVAERALVVAERLLAVADQLVVAVVGQLASGYVDLET